MLQCDSSDGSTDVSGYRHERQFATAAGLLLPWKICSRLYVVSITNGNNFTDDLMRTVCLFVTFCHACVHCRLTYFVRPNVVVSFVVYYAAVLNS